MLRVASVYKLTNHLWILIARNGRLDFVPCKSVEDGGDLEGVFSRNRILFRHL